MGKSSDKYSLPVLILTLFLLLIFETFNFNIYPTALAQSGGYGKAAPSPPSPPGWQQFLNDIQKKFPNINPPSP